MASVGMDNAVEEDQGDLGSRLNALGLVLAKYRAEAIEGRSQSGIEDEWIEDEEYYEGIDDQNRRELRAWRSKPLGQPGLPSQDDGPSSTAFVNITRPYVDATSARIGDMVLPTDDSAWSIEPTPIPGMGLSEDGKLSPKILHEIDAAFPGNPEQQGVEVQRMAEQAKAMHDEYREKAQKATKQIEDWHVEGQFHGEMRKVFDDTAKVGCGVLKGPYPEKRRAVAYKDAALVISSEIKPTSRRIAYWNFYPDPGCGENIHDGGFVFERDDITARKLQALIGSDEYIEEQIMAVLREGPSTATKKVPEHTEQLTQGVRREGKNLYEIWYFHGDLDSEDLAACGCEVEEGTTHAAVATMVNNRVIKGNINPLDTGEYPYDVMVMQARDGMPWGRGVARQIRTSQDIVKGAARNMLDNAGIAGGPQLILKQGMVWPADGITEISPLKIWIAAEDADTDHLDNAFRFVVVPMLQKELEAIIYLGLKLAEDTTGMPMLLQGQVGQSTPDTLGGQQMMQNNASTVLRRIARLYDDRMTEPHIRRYYAYLLQYGEDEAKGDFQIDARGSSTLVERDLQSQQIAQLGAMVSNPIFGIDPKKWMTEYLKSQRLDPKRFEFDDDEWKALIEQMGQQPQDQSLAIAEIKANTEAMKLELTARTTDAELHVQVLEAEKDRALEMGTEYMKREIEAMRLSGTKEVSLDQIEAKLADSAMKLRTQLKLAGMTNALKATEVANAPTEPPGRAPAGEAYQK